MRKAHEKIESGSSAFARRLVGRSWRKALMPVGKSFPLLSRLGVSRPAWTKTRDDALPATADRLSTKAVDAAYPATKKPLLSYRNLAVRADLLEGDVPVHECTLLAGSVCVACGLSQLTLMSSRDAGASPLTLAVAMVGVAAATFACLFSWRRSLQKARLGKTPKLGKDAMTEGERALLKSLLHKPIRISYRRDGWRPSGSLPAPATTADLNALIRDRFAKVDHDAGSIVVEK